jgi:hypothetical protein
MANRVRPLSRSPIDEGVRVDESLIARIVTQVLALLAGNGAKPAGRRVLTVFGGASAGQQAGLSAITQLTGRGHQVTVAFSPAGNAMVGEERVRTAGAQKVIAPGGWVDAPALVADAELVLLPTLSMNLAAHLAAGLLDSLPATLVVGALLAGKPVLAVRDGADPDGAAGKVFGANGSAPALRAKLAGNLKVLASYGVELVAEADFLDAVERLVVGSAPRITQAAVTQASNTPTSRVSAPLITQADLAGLPEGTRLRVAPGSRLTPLARDSAASMGIELVYE